METKTNEKLDEKILILLVDDDRMNLRRAQEILAGDNVKIAATLSGEQALSFMEKNTPDVILLDINMPGIDGFETYKKIRALPNGQTVPVIFLTAQEDAETEVLGFEMGADDFIRKPFVDSIVEKRVFRSIEGAKLRNDLQSEVKKQARKAEERRKALDRITFEVIQTLAATIDTKDPYTKGHSTRVSDYAVLLARKLGWDDSQVEELRIMALLHDVGKIAIPDRVLNKPGRLEADEYEIIKSHTVHGDRILKEVSSLVKISMVARHHHERYDGKGYPDKLAGNEIEIEARIVGIADSYDAMSSDRVYRKALPEHIIREELVKGRGTQFDPKLLDIFLQMFDSHELEDIKEISAPQSMCLDISELMDSIGMEGAGNGAIKLSHTELVKIYAYLKNNSERYGTAFKIVMVTMNFDENSDYNEEHMEQAMTAMEYSIVQCLRKSDMTSRVSKTQQIVVLTEANENYIDAIVERVFNVYYKNCLYIDIKPSYEINE